MTNERLTKQVYQGVPGQTVGKTRIVRIIEEHKVVTLPEPVDTVISKSFESVCSLRGFDAELKVLMDYSVRVAGRINTKLWDKKLKLRNLLTPICRENIKLRLMVEGLIKKVCNSKAPRAKIVQQIINQTCSSLVPAVIIGWWKGMAAEIPNHADVE
ncbi:uncharacterized protein LOC117182926 [Belonocnema kinseyi]|uniref:uncharacterized protein LOC117182926 n=1 Tax=Belonocnema kinseyi TaxID=2817044 RepID=UPI00143CF4BD|nr:uncharacterized protein LOC117182926 [Belonocnema kinseyi]